MEIGKRRKVAPVALSRFPLLPFLTPRCNLRKSTPFAHSAGRVLGEAVFLLYLAEPDAYDLDDSYPSAAFVSNIQDHAPETICDLYRVITTEAGFAAIR